MLSCVLPVGISPALLMVPIVKSSFLEYREETEIPYFSVET